MPQINAYYNMAKVLSSKMDNALVLFFEDFVSRTGGIELQSQMQEWSEKAKDISQYRSGPSFLNYIWFILSNENSEFAKEPRDKYFEKRRQARFYWNSVIKKEKAAGFSSGLLRNDCSSYFELLRYSNTDDMKRYSSEEDYLETRFNAVMEWGKNKDSNLVSFPQIFHLSHKKIADYIFIDCAFRAYDTILSSMNGNVVDGYYTIMPQLVNEGLFSFSSRSKEMEAKVRDDSIIVVDTVNDKYSAVFDRIEGDFSEAIVNGTQKQLVESFVRNGKLSLINDVLDATDQKLLTKILGGFSVQYLNQGHKRTNILSLVKAVYHGKPRREHYIDVIERLKKLSKCRIEVMERNSQGNLVSGGIISFFDLIFLTGELSTDDSQTDVAIIDGASQTDIVDVVSAVKELNKLDVDIMPSQYIKKERREGMVALHRKVLAELLDVNMSNKANMMLTFLLSERISIYPASSCSLPYELFVEKLRIVESRKKRALEQIRSAIGELKEIGILIKDFTMNEYSVDITFLPMTDNEKLVYNLEEDYSDKLLIESEG